MPCHAGRADQPETYIVGWFLLLYRVRPRPHRRRRRRGQHAIITRRRQQPGSQDIPTIKQGPIWSGEARVGLLPLRTLHYTGSGMTEFSGMAKLIPYLAISG